MEKQKRIAIYTRVSTSEQNVEMQSTELNRFAESRGWQIVEIFSDHGFSGKNTKRPALNQLMNSASKREFDLVLVWKLDRFARSLSDLITMIQHLADVGVEFVSLKDNLDLSTSQGRLMLHLLGAFAQFERDLIVSRVRAGLENAKRNGQRLGRPQKRDDEKIRKLRDRGLTHAEIAALLGISEGSVRNGLPKSAKNPSKTDPASARNCTGQKA